MRSSRTKWPWFTGRTRRSTTRLESKMVAPAAPFLQRRRFCCSVPLKRLALLLRGNTRLERGDFFLSLDISQQEAVLEKFAFSNALCLSGKVLLQCSGPVLVLLLTCAFSPSEVGHLGGGFRQLCGVHPVHPRGQLMQKF